MLWQIFGAAFGVAIGHEVLRRVRLKHGRIPWQFTASIWAVIAVTIYLGMLSISPNPPAWMLN